MADTHSHDHNGHSHDTSQQTATWTSNTTIEEMRKKQQPLKAGYKDDASAALITLKSSGYVLPPRNHCQSGELHKTPSLQPPAHSWNLPRPQAKAKANITHRSSLDSTSITCALDGPNSSAIRSAHAKVAGLHPYAGGEGAEISGELCSGDMLLEALVACSGVTLKAVASALDIPIESGKVRAEGDLDFRGTLGVDKTAPVGFKAIRLSFELKMRKGVEVEEGKIEKLGKLTERYCVVLQTIKTKPELAVRVDGTTEAEDGVERSVAWAEKV